MYNILVFRRAKKINKENVCIIMRCNLDSCRIFINETCIQIVPPSFHYQREVIKHSVLKGCAKYYNCPVATESH